MASLSRKNRFYVVRFRYGGKQYKKSLRTPDKSDGEGDLNLIQHAVPPDHRPSRDSRGVDRGDFIVSGGQATVVSQPTAPPPSSPTLALPPGTPKEWTASLRQLRGLVRPGAGGRGLGWST